MVVAPSYIPNHPIPRLRLKVQAEPLVGTTQLDREDKLSSQAKAGNNFLCCYHIAILWKKKLLYSPSSSRFHTYKHTQTHIMTDVC